MDMFSSCAGKCYTCACTSGCLAGHGDDDYVPASKEEIVNRAEKELEVIRKIMDLRPSTIRSFHLSELRSAQRKLKAYLEALAKGSW